MNGIYTFDDNSIPFDKITLATPQGIQGGTYLSKIKINNEDFKIQTPESKTKSGVIKTDKKIYSDLMVDMNNEEFNYLIESIENAIKDLIFHKKDTWFHSEMDSDSIDYHWQPVLRKYQGNKHLLRCSIKKFKNPLTSKSVMVYDTNENKLTLNDVDKDTNIVTIIKINGLKFTSQSFSLDIHLEQIMVMPEKKENDKCLIRINKPLEETGENTDKTETYDLDADKTATTDVDTEKTETYDLDADKTATTDIDTEKTTTADIETEKTTTADIETEKTATADVETEKTATDDVETEKTATDDVETDKIATTDVETDKIATTDVETDKIVSSLEKNVDKKESKKKSRWLNLSY